MSLSRGNLSSKILGLLNRKLSGGFQQILVLLFLISLIFTLLSPILKLNLFVLAALASGLFLFVLGVILFYQQYTHSHHQEKNHSIITPQALSQSDFYVELNRNPEIITHTPMENYTHCQTDGIEHQYINIHNQQVKISTDIGQVLDNLKDIFLFAINQSPNPLFVINEFAQDLQEQLHQYPELKLYFCVDGEASEQELVNQIIKFVLLPQTYPIQKLDANGDLVKIEYLEDETEIPDKCISIYKGYRIHLHQNQNNRWTFRIQKRDFSFLELKRQPRRYRKRANAIATAKKLIRKDIFQAWQSSIDVRS